MDVQLVPVGPVQVAPALAAETSWRVVLDAYLDAAVDSPNTRRAYRRHLVDALTALGVHSLADLSGALLAAYRAAVVSSTLAPATRAQALAAVRSFLTWSRTMGAHGLSGDVVRAALRTPSGAVQRPYSVLTEPEVLTVLQAATAPRDRALLAVLLGAGLRVSEAVGLDVADVLEEQEGGVALWVRQGKGRKDRIVPMPPGWAREVRGYLAATGRLLGGAGPLFLAADRAVHTRQGRL